MLGMTQTACPKLLIRAGRLQYSAGLQSFSNPFWHIVCVDGAQQLGHERGVGRGVAVGAYNGCYVHGNTGRTD